MKRFFTQKYCAKPHELAMLARDGIGWGHDLQCGSFHATGAPHATSVQIGKRRVK